MAEPPQVPELIGEACPQCRACLHPQPLHQDMLLVLKKAMDISLGVSTMGKRLCLWIPPSVELASLFPFSAVAYMVSPVAVTKFDELDAAGVVLVLVLDLEVVVMLELLVLDGEDSVMYRGWALNDGRSGNLPQMLQEIASTTHFMFGLNCGSWRVHRRPT